MLIYLPTGILGFKHPTANLIKSQIVGSRQQRARKLNFILESQYIVRDIMLARIVQSEKNGRVIPKS